ncbi:hypothetical protein NEUTE2DRAFT_55470, partial [Neurospora tetrasperma FGSC 2509]
GMGCPGSQLESGDAIRPRVADPVAKRRLRKAPWVVMATAWCLELLDPGACAGVVYFDNPTSKT